MLSQRPVYYRHPYAQPGYVLRFFYGRERLDSLKIFYSDHFVLPLPEGHRFPMAKYSMLRKRIAQANICRPGEMHVPRAVSDGEILRAHEETCLRSVVDGTLTEEQMR